MLFFIAIHGGLRIMMGQHSRSERTKVPAFAAAQCQRRKVEALFAELKNQIGLRRVRLRRLKHVREQFFLAAAAQNLKRLARFRRLRSLESATVPI